MYLLAEWLFICCDILEFIIKCVLKCGAVFILDIFYGKKSTFFFRKKNVFNFFVSLREKPWG